jgi:hypothetical protein
MSHGPRLRTITAALLAIALSGCNALYGLDDTRNTSEIDRDGDGVSDADDNCPTTKNQDQANTDGDALGDACDGCPTLQNASNHDEDRDALPDDCDPCPAIEDFHADLDLDGVADLCDDPGERLESQRAIFEPFTSLGAPWIPQGTWNLVAGDAVAPDDKTSDLALSGVALGQGRVFVMLESSELWTPGDRFGIRMIDPDRQVEAFRCEVVCDATGCNGTCDGDAIDVTTLVLPVVTPAPVVTIRLDVAPTSIGFNVSTADSPVDGVVHANAARRWSVTLLTSPRIAIAGVDIVDETGQTSIVPP